MGRNFKFVLLFILLISIIPTIIGLAQSQQYYYIQTTSPIYSIVPGSEFVQPLNSSLTLYIAVLLNFTNVSSLQNYLNKVYFSPIYFHHWLTPYQFREYYYPPNSYIKSLVKYLE